MNKFPDSIVVTDQEIDLTKLTQAQREHFVKLKDRVVELYEIGAQKRAIISFAGQSGIGKSVTVELLKRLMEIEDHDFTVQKVGLDAFHYPNAILAERNLHDVKGRYDTYDTDEMNKVLLRFLHGHSTSFPQYSRELHAPVRGGFLISEEKALILFEGLWLLRDDEEWAYFRKLFSYNFLIKGSEEESKENTISRHVQGGRSEEDARAFYQSSDHLNTLEVLNNSVQPDEIIQYYGSI